MFWILKNDLCFVLKCVYVMKYYGEIILERIWIVIIVLKFSMVFVSTTFRKIIFKRISVSCWWCININMCLFFCLNVVICIKYMYVNIVIVLNWLKLCTSFVYKIECEVKFYDILIKFIVNVILYLSVVFYGIMCKYVDFKYVNIVYCMNSDVCFGMFLKYFSFRLVSVVTTYAKCIYFCIKGCICVDCLFVNYCVLLLVFVFLFVLFFVYCVLLFVFALSRVFARERDARAYLFFFCVCVVFVEFFEIVFEFVRKVWCLLYCFCCCCFVLCGVCWCVVVVVFVCVWY